ncbi:uncharacterized protein [Amphiura filiformis]|uniref:uncharacterized protein isoform X2 n=1 Tax=Amphiura filiformis TaxID=82378 RepID=UPI003B220EE8
MARQTSCTACAAGTGTAAAMSTAAADCLDAPQTPGAVTTGGPPPTTALPPAPPPSVATDPPPATPAGVTTADQPATTALPPDAPQTPGAVTTGGPPPTTALPPAPPPSVATDPPPATPAGVTTADQPATTALPPDAPQTPGAVTTGGPPPTTALPPAPPPSVATDPPPATPAGVTTADQPATTALPPDAPQTPGAVTTGGPPPTTALPPAPPPSVATDPPPATPAGVTTADQPATTALPPAPPTSVATDPPATPADVTIADPPATTAPPPDCTCALPQLSSSQVAELEINRDQLMIDMGGNGSLHRLKEEPFYTRPLFTLNPSQEREILNSCIGSDIFWGPRRDFENTRHKRQSSSRICPPALPQMTYLVTLTGGDLAQIIHMNDRIQWVFNEECRRSYCQGGCGCTCRKVSRTVAAYVMVIPWSGTTPPYMAWKNVRIYSCAALM